MDFLELVLKEAQAQHWAEWTAVIAAVIYLVLAAAASPWCWVFGMVSCAFWAYAAFELYDLYVDALLQVFYLVISVLGLYQWFFGGAGRSPRQITTMPIYFHILLIIAGLGSTYGVGWLFEQYTEAAVPYLDAFTTVFSVIITFMVIYKKLENWVYWLVVDSVYVYLYWSRGSYLFTILFVVYLILVLIGMRRWNRLYVEATVV